MPPLFLADICHVPDSEVEQEDRAGYVPRCDIAEDDDITEDDDLRENEDDAIHNATDVEEAQLVGSRDVPDTNEIVVTSSGFTDLPTLSSPDNTNCLMQIYQHIHQSLSEVYDIEQNTLNRTIYQI